MGRGSERGRRWNPHCACSRRPVNTAPAPDGR
ncbi:hypothetical protein chiPu_0023444, partial [Chiloscyllium punctatum]|nr:hypothetical protein [Chiloscyllium punctatum]